MKAELYKVLYDHETDQEDELAVKANEIIRVTNKDSPDWWLAEKVDNSKEFGLVPSNFVEKIAHEEDKKLAMVLQDYTAQSSDELTLQANGIITILDQDVAEGWWKGDLNGKIGVFPADHVTLLSESTHEQGRSKKDGFKLAAFGVKQGGIGSILAGGLGLKRSSTTGGHRTSIQSTTVSSSAESQPMAIPPRPQPVKTQSTASKSSSSTHTSPTKAMILHDYKPENDDEIQLMRGEYVTILDQMENDGWWKGKNEAGNIGVFPSNFAQIVDQEVLSPPPRPTRTRPATVVKPETTPVAKPDTTQAQPPPVPVGTRPTSLLTQRDVSSTPPPRPTTLPPRPQTQPVAPPRRIDTNKHKRMPSIPLTSPDLPPLSPVHDQKPTRPIPQPGEMVAQKSPTDVLQTMAKPPKILTKSKPSTETNSQEESVPVIPKRSMPSVQTALENDSAMLDAGQVRRLIQAETDALRQMFEAKLEQERQERLKLRAELQQLKASLHLT
ncbi:SH3 domain-containing kinase-binding protein 1 [Choanephora cucurbitarum]|uniref:SH3 domain-containing kinase-binding protein 1 n=1 Tax=Choanephora cucurbitarum TaxID=101091 RepID=A0A1C7NCW9_9FUNG|nr:SH3 domain-containing kinase-binding protein 1 [Choanephora cucurbitarum]